jgi:predicted O-methyltransferase YrrM
MGGKSLITCLSSADDMLFDLFSQETANQKALRVLTQETVTHHHMMSPKGQAQLLRFLIQLTGASAVLEVGVFTGYTTLVMAEALPKDGRLVACDHNAHWPKVGWPYWAAAGVSDRIHLVIAPALETLAVLFDEKGPAQFDFIFIDADKIHYADYFACADRLLMPGGLIIFDNVIQVHQQAVVAMEKPATRAIYHFLHQAQRTSGYNWQLLPVGEGMLLGTKAA